MIKRKKLFVAIMLTFALCFASVSSAFAAQAPNGLNNQADATAADPNAIAVVDADGGVGAIVSDTPDESVQAAITKVLQTPVGTVLPSPAPTFNFTATPEGVLNDVGGTDASVVSEMPALTNLTSLAVGTTGVTSGNTTSYTSETGDIFANITSTSFPHAGVYVYDIEEDQSSALSTNTETLTCSGAKYTLYVYVANDSAGTGTYIKAIGDVVTSSIDNANQTPNYKVDPTPGQHGMVFTNTYVHTNYTATPTATNNTLAVSKKVDGDYADLTLPFTFSMTLTAPDVTTGDNLSKAQDADSTPTGNAGPYTAIIVDSTTGLQVAGTSSVTFTSGQAQTFTLKNGQTLAFGDTPVGTTFNVTETAADGYTATQNVSANSASVTAAGTTYTANTAIAAPALASGDWLVSEQANKAAYVNTYKTITPTGIIINNLPYIGLIVLAVGAVVVYVTTKSRKRNSYNH